MTELTIVKFQEMASATDAQLLVVLIPSKTLVYSSVLEQFSSELPEVLFEHIRLDKILKNDIIGFLENNKFGYIDVTDGLVEMISNKQNPYYDVPNEHPNAAGYKVIANAISKAFSD